MIRAQVSALREAIVRKNHVRWAISIPFFFFADALEGTVQQRARMSHTGPAISGAASAAKVAAQRVRGRRSHNKTRFVQGGSVDAVSGRVLLLLSGEQVMVLTSCCTADARSYERGGPRGQGRCLDGIIAAASGAGEWSAEQPAADSSA